MKKGGEFDPCWQFGAMQIAPPGSITLTTKLHFTNLSMEFLKGLFLFGWGPLCCVSRSSETNIIYTFETSEPSIGIHEGTCIGMRF